MIIGPTYNLNDRLADAERAINLFPVPGETGGDIAYMAAVPGLVVFSGGGIISDIGAILLEIGGYVLLQSGGHILLETSESEDVDGGAPDTVYLLPPYDGGSP